MASKPASDLLNNPIDREVGETPTATVVPFDRAVELLSSKEGQMLELMTRTTPQIADACNVAYNLIARYDSDYIRGRIDMIMRLAVSQKGEGRKEIDDSLKAGAKAMLDKDKVKLQPTWIDALEDD